MIFHLIHLTAQINVVAVKITIHTFYTTSFFLLFTCFLMFLNCQDIELIPGKTVDFEVYTNRKVLKKSLILSQPDHYFRLP